MKPPGEIVFDSRLSPAIDALVLERCARAKEFEASGDYEAGGVELATLGRWRGVGHHPVLDGLGPRAAAELLLRAGALTGWLGSAQQLAGAQEAAKDLLTEGMRILEGLGDSRGTAEARMELALCYWREAAYDEGRVLLREALDLLGDSDRELRARILLRAVTIERSAGRLSEALAMLVTGQELFGSVDDEYLKGCFFSMRGLTYKNLYEHGGDSDHIDRALLEYTAASASFEQVGHSRYQAGTENNIGQLLRVLGRFADAHEHLEYARGVYFGLKDRTGVAQVDDSRARLEIAERRYDRAAAIARQAVAALTEGGEHGLLCEALTTLGVALARAGAACEAEEQLRRAVSVAETAGDGRRGAVAALTMVEELHGHLGVPELCDSYCQADRLAGESPAPTLISRLRVGVRVVMEEAARQCSSPPLPCDLKELVRLLERSHIERALRESDGEITHAARLLGYRHPQSLVSIMESRHTDLLAQRKPAKRRHRSLLRKRKPA